MLKHYVLPRLTLFLLALLSGFLALCALWWVEHAFMPVVTDWRLTAASVHGRTVTAAGVLDKVRPCRLDQTVILLVRPDGVGRVVAQIKGEGNALGTDVPEGLSTWGPLTVDLPADLPTDLGPRDVFKVVGMHVCHRLWRQETVYGTVPALRVLGGGQ